MDVNKRKKDTVTDAEKLLMGENTGIEIKISPDTGGLLYRCDKNGNPYGSGYEGVLILRMEK